MPSGVRGPVIPSSYEESLSYCDLQTDAESP
jgi:hypothetical protein